MVAIFVRESALRLFAMATRLGLRRLPLFNRAFLTLYPLYKKHFEAGPIDRLREFAPPGSVVIDVGANIGFFSVRFAEWVGNNGEVISIEPEEQNFGNLTAALASRGFAGRVRLIKAVAAASPGSMRIEINRLHPADHKISRDGTGLAVRAVTLDGLVGETNPSLIKIDVQGAEMMVLEGAGKLLRRAKPALFIELSEDGLNALGASVTEVLSYLDRLGYRSYWLARAGPHVRATDDDIRAKVKRDDYVDVLFLNEADFRRSFDRPNRV